MDPVQYYQLFRRLGERRAPSFTTTRLFYAPPKVDARFYCDDTPASHLLHGGHNGSSWISSPTAPDCARNSPILHLQLFCGPVRLRPHRSDCRAPPAGLFSLVDLLCVPLILPITTVLVISDLYVIVPQKSIARSPHQDLAPESMRQEDLGPDADSGNRPLERRP